VAEQHPDVASIFRNDMNAFIAHREQRIAKSPTPSGRLAWQPMKSVGLNRAANPTMTLHIGDLMEAANLQEKSRD